MKNNIFGNDNNNNNSSQRGKKPKFNILWMYAIIMAVILGIYWSNDVSTSREVSWTKFKECLESKGVDSIVVYTNKLEANAFLNDSLSRVMFNASDNNKRIHNPASISTQIPSTDKFVEQLDSLSKKDVYTGPVRYATASDISSWIWGFGPILLLILFWFWMTKRMAGGAGGAGGIFSVGKSKAKLFDKNDQTKVTFKDVAGLAEAKTEVAEIVDFLKSPQRYTNLGGKIPKGALLVGPPGTGKTLLAKAVAGEADVPFFSLSGSDFVEMFVGVGASRVRDLFKQAKDKAPCIVFIDEIDAVGRARGNNPKMGSNDERESTLNQLLTEMDGFGTNSGIIILAATNRVDILDKALLRAGRFDRQIYVDLPELNDRKEIFQVHLRGVKTDGSVDLNLLARQTPGFSGADIANVCNEAALIAARHHKVAVQKQDFNSAIDRIIGGLEKASKVMTEEERNSIAVHEAGHATVSWQLQYGDPLIKVTIVPRGKALGAAWYMPEERQITPRQALLDKICSLMAGRVAEEMFLGIIDTGALNDLERATKIAYAMVTYYGMGNSLPNVSYYDSSENYGFTKPYSEERAQSIDKEVQDIIDQEYKRAREILEQYADGHHQLAQLLLQREVIYTEDVENVFGKRKWTSRTDILEGENNQIENNNTTVALPAGSQPANGSTDKNIPDNQENNNDNNQEENNDQQIIRPPKFNK
ncbi:MAG: ATP-dependent zinc metalloprotease FtsH [Muribaculaceae bacterium]|nr:ATP-dependent zinc metalloprotease FtsH [Muribaculaceae bacterium]